MEKKKEEWVKNIYKMLFDKGDFRTVEGKEQCVTLMELGNKKIKTNTSIEKWLKPTHIVNKCTRCTRPQ